MSFRLMRICSEESTFLKRQQELKYRYLIPRGYKDKNVDFQFARIHDLPGNNYTEKRLFALKKKQSIEKDNRVIFPTTYNPHTPNIKDILKNIIIM